MSMLAEVLSAGSLMCTDARFFRTAFRGELCQGLSAPVLLPSCIFRGEDARRIFFLQSLVQCAELFLAQFGQVGGREIHADERVGIL